MTLTQILERAVRYFPQQTACVAGDVRLTYRELHARVNRLANALRGLGVQPGDRVAVLSANSLPYLELYYATAALGAPIVPLNFRLAPAELAYILQDSGSSVLVVGEGHEALGAETLQRLEARPRLITTAPAGWAGAQAYEELLAQASPDFTPVAVAEDHLAGLFYTSGTTGHPKGVMLSHRNLMSNALHFLAAVQEEEGEVYLHCCPMFHLADGPTSHRITWLGGTHVILPGFDAEAVLEAIARERVTSLLLVPTMINFLVNHPRVTQYDLSSLRRICYGASPMPVELLRRAAKVFGCPFIQLYGLTETSPLLTMMHPKYLAFEGEEAKVRRLASCGRAVPGVEVRVVNARMEDVQPGEVGEIVARGPNVMRGYWNKPEETAAAFRDGWFCTGDLATVDAEQFIFIVDRKKDMIITGGENVYSTEVENVLYQHPAVLEAAVIGVPDERWGEAVLALVVLKPGMAATEAELIAHCRERIAHYKCPRRVEFRSEPFPKSGSGKILKTVLREPYWQGHERRVH
ncbi:MAG: fatty-acid--CoA ligase [Candidatus Tectimicrobiota bacterium]|nr:MAG: fatty-acid--CoA ligase [Candidatus Tectomicrobia bacterium]